MVNLYLLIKTLLLIILYYFSSTKRYINLLILILKFRPKSILEIGVFNGERSKQLIQASKIFNKDICFYGFDLFELIIGDNKLKNIEASKFPLTMSKIKKKLSRINDKNYFYKGFSSTTLKEFSVKNRKIDYIFIDGGHSIKTINSDWKYSKKIVHDKGIIIFDDYYIGLKNKIKKIGCNQLINNLDKKKYLIKKLPFTDYFYKNGTKFGIKMILARKK